MRGRAWLAVMLLCAAIAAHAGEWTFKSLRRPVAKVSQEEGMWRIVVTFLPVSAFDDSGKNLTENRRLAKTFAEWGLMRELGATNDQMLEVSGFETQAFVITDEMAKASFAVPVANVKLVTKPKAELTTAIQGESEAELTWAAQFSEVKFDNQQIAQFLHKNPFFMETGGAKIIRMADGRVLAIAIGMIDVSKPKTMRKKMAENRARSALVSSVHGVRTYTSSMYSEKAKIHVADDKEEAELFEESAETIVTESAGWAPGLPIVGSWILKEDEQFCVAIGEILSAERAKELLKTK